VEDVAAEALQEIAAAAHSPGQLLLQRVELCCMVCCLLLQLSTQLSHQRVISLHGNKTTAAHNGCEPWHQQELPQQDYGRWTSRATADTVQCLFEQL
jgi:hypothetical protein